MKIFIVLLSLGLTLWLVSCEKEKEPVDTIPADLTGFWINPQYSDSLVIYERADAFNDGPGIYFLSNGSLVEHKNAGFCGTPPITYADYNGSYTVNDSVISASVGYWGGTSDYKWKLISLSREELTLKLMSVAFNESQ